jgi:hypothetical protein
LDGNLTSGYTNLTYVNTGDGTPLVTSTPTNIEPALPAPGPALMSWWLNSGFAPGRTVHFIARGVVSTAAASPGTLTLGVALAGTTLQSTPAFTPAVSLNNGWWEMEGDLVFRTGGAAAQVQCSGQLTIAASATAASDMASYPFPANSAAASWETAVDATMAGAYTPVPFHIRATWGAAAAGDSIACLLVKLWPDN